MKNEQKCYNTGKMFAESIDVETHKIGELHYVCISWGDNYYETDGIIIGATPIRS